MEITDAKETLHVHNSDITESRFSNPKLVKCSFDDVNCQRSTFTNTNLMAASFVDVDFTNASINDANLTGMKNQWRVGVRLDPGVSEPCEIDRQIVSSGVGAVLSTKNPALVQALYQVS